MAERGVGPTQQEGLARSVYWDKEADKMMFLEIKRPSGVQSPDQVHFQGLCDMAGVVYKIVRSVEECIEVLGLQVKR